MTYYKIEVEHRQFKIMEIWRHNLPIIGFDYTIYHLQVITFNRPLKSPGPLTLIKKYWKNKGQYTGLL